MDLKDRINIIEFCKDKNLLDIPLLETQEVLLRAAYALPMTKDQKQLYWHMTGFKAPNVAEAYQETVWILGGRSGKTTIAGAIACYEACCTDWTRFIRKGELAWVFVMATKEQQAIDLGRNVIFSALDKSPILRDLVIDDPAILSVSVLPRTRTGVKVLKTGAAITALPCSARVGRGYPICCFILDEIAWFAKESRNETTDIGVYGALNPRTIQFGKHAKKVIISTPGDKSGLLYKRWIDRDKYKKDYWVVKIPTWKIRTDYPKEVFEQHKRLSPLDFDREYGANFMNTLTPLMNREEVEAVCRRDEDKLVLSYNPDHSYMMALDAAFGEGDRFAIAIGHSEEIKNGQSFKPILDLVEAIEPYEDIDLIDTAVERVVELYKQYDIFEVYMDQYQADALGKILEARGCNVNVEDWTAAQHRLKYGRLKNFIKRKLIELPPSEELVEEISGLQIKFLPGSGQYTVTHKPGGHDDLADVVAEVVYHLTDDEATEAGIIVAGKEMKT